MNLPMDINTPSHHDLDNPAFPPRIGPPPSIETGDLALNLQGKLNDLQEARLDLGTSFWKATTKRYNKYQQKFNEWFKLVNEHRSELEGRGKADDAKWLATALYLDTNLFQQNCFRSTFALGCGSISVTIVGRDEKKQARSWYQSPAASVCETSPAPASTCAATSQTLSLSEPVDLEHLRPTTFYASARIALSDALQKKLWINWCNGIAFCICCPHCADIVAPRADLVLPDTLCYELVPRQFHGNPLDKDAAIRHFEDAHQETFPAGVLQMVEKYGTRVTPDNTGARIDRWTIEANNFAVQQWHTQALSNWKNIRGQQPSTFRELNYQAQVQHITSLRRYIDEDIASTSYVFDWPDAALPGVRRSTWAVFCTDPDCTSPAFQEHPLKNNRAMDHFRRHGFSVRDDYQILELFGFQVLPKQEQWRLLPRRRKPQNMTFKQLERRCKRFDIDTTDLDRAGMVLALGGQPNQTKDPSISRRRREKEPDSLLKNKVKRMNTVKLIKELESRGIRTENLERAEMKRAWLESMRERN